MVKLLILNDFVMPLVLVLLLSGCASREPFAACYRSSASGSTASIELSKDSTFLYSGQGGLSNDTLKGIWSRTKENLILRPYPNRLLEVSQGKHDARLKITIMDAITLDTLEFASIKIEEEEQVLVNGVYSGKALRNASFSMFGYQSSLISKDTGSFNLLMYPSFRANDQFILQARRRALIHNGTNFYPCTQ